MTTPLKSMALVLLASFIGSFGAVFLKSGSSRIRFKFPDLFLNYHLGLGVLFFLASSYFFVLGLREGELSVLYPMVSLSYIWTLFWSRLVFKEPFTGTKFLGLALILTGVFFIGLGTTR